MLLFFKKKILTSSLSADSLLSYTTVYHLYCYYLFLSACNFIRLSVLTYLQISSYYYKPEFNTAVGRGSIRKLMFEYKGSIPNNQMQKIAKFTTASVARNGCLQSQEQ